VNEKLESIFELPTSYRAGILGGAVALVLGGYYFMFYGELGVAIKENRDAISSLELEIAEKSGIAANLPKFEREVEKLEVELKKALRELPDKKEIDLLLTRISDKARDAGLDIKLFEPQAEQLKDFYAEVPVAIEVTGNYHQVATFFDEVGRLKRIVNMDQFDLSTPTMVDGSMDLKTAATATSFRFLDPSERPSVNDKKKKRRRRG
jgi:type IV pilus assembly protein PilO